MRLLKCVFFPYKEVPFRQILFPKIKLCRSSLDYRWWCEIVKTTSANNLHKDLRHPLSLPSSEYTHLCREHSGARGASVYCIGRVHTKHRHNWWRQPISTSFATTCTPQNKVNFELATHNASRYKKRDENSANTLLLHVIYNNILIRIRSSGFRSSFGIYMLYWAGVCGCVAVMYKNIIF